MVGEVQEPVLCDYQEVGSFTPRPFLKTEPIIVDPPQIKTEPEDCKVFPEVGTDPGCNWESGVVKMEPVSPVSENSNSLTRRLTTIQQGGKLSSNS